ncbi:MAG: two-component sensor histidine kinase [Thermoleophilia bacterium]|nr:two-component sensor histidine kinase [Thermoleophilia bacterium]
MRLVTRIFRSWFGAPGAELTRRQRYAYMWKLFITVMSTAVIVPLAVATTISFYQYRSLSNQETRDKLTLDTQSAKQAFEYHINETLSTMLVVAQGYEYGELFEQDNLETLFARLRNEYWWVVDLGALDVNGVQKAYVGPFPFQGVDYSGQDWFQNAYSRKSNVSDIFTGYRGSPHFVVSVTNGVPGSDGYWMLRASIDAEHLKGFITTINTDAATDMFLVGQDGTLRTRSNNHGSVGDPYGGPLAALNHVTVQETKESGSPELMAQTQIEGLPWILVLERQGLVHGNSWNQFRMQLFGIVFLCAAAALYIIFRVTRVMINMIVKADTRRDEILAEAQHTAKLASVGQLAAGVAHEINNPLAIITEKIGLIQDLTKQSSTFSEKERFLDLTKGAADAVERCRDITHRLLGFARRMDVKTEPVRLNDVIRDVISFVEREAGYRNIRIEMSLDDEIPAIISDRGQLQQIFLNIINNAIDAVDKDGFIRIGTTVEKSGMVSTTITDSGPGIPSNIIGHIFEPFFTTKFRNDTSGTGLGLSITYGLVKKLCGQINAKSPPGEGASFIVEFPVNCDAVD